MKKNNDGWGYQSPPEQPIEIGQEVYYTPDFGNHGHGFAGGVTLLDIQRETCTIEITNLVPRGSECDHGTKVHYGELGSALIVQVPREHIYHYEWTRDW